MKDVIVGEEKKNNTEIVEEEKKNNTENVTNHP